MKSTFLKELQEKYLPFFKLVSSKVPSMIRHNFGRKFFAFIFTLLLFFYVRNMDGSKQKNSDLTIGQVPVQLILPQDVVFLTQGPPKLNVTLTVSGPEYYMKGKTLSAEDFEIIVKASKDNVKGESLFVKLTPQNVDIKRQPLLGGKVTVTDIDPDNIVLAVDTIISKKVPIHIVCSEQEIPEGYTLEKIGLPKEQDKVTVVGPSRILDNIKKVDTLHVPLKDYTSDFTTQVALVPPTNPDVKLIPDAVTVIGKITDYEKRSFEDVPVQVLLSYPFDFKKIEKFTLEPKTVRIDFSEPRRSDPLERVLLGAFHPMVDVAGLDAGSGSVKRDIQLRCDKPDVKNMSVTPATITVTVKAADKEGTEPPEKEAAK